MKEEWRLISGYENYLVSDIGRVKNRRTGQILKPGMSRWYLQVGLYKNGPRKGLRVHRLVAQAFIPNPDNLPEVNHINGDKTDNRAINLEWCTSSENGKHAYRIGLRKVSRKQVDASIMNGKKASSKKVYCIELDREFCSAREAHRQTGVSYASISYCCLGKLKSAGRHPDTGEKLTWWFAG